MKCLLILTKLPTFICADNLSANIYWAHTVGWIQPSLVSKLGSTTLAFWRTVIKKEYCTTNTVGLPEKVVFAV
jgi:hypothetical protein